jgi:cell division protein FtsI (penicillin-binding protein 3)
MEYIYANDPTLHATIDKAAEPYTPESIKGGKTNHVATIGKLAHKIDDSSEGESWSRAVVEEQEVKISGLKIESGKVPDVRGMGLSDALYILEQAGLKVSHRGSGRVKSQSLAPGRGISENMKIELLLER